MTCEAVERERQSILRGLASPDEELRRLAVEQVLVLSLAEALPHLLNRLGDPSWRVRKAAVERLLACDESEQIDDAVIKALGDGENSGRRNSAFEALLGIGSRVMPKLMSALSSDDVDVRKLVVDVMAGIGDPSGCAPMIGMLDDPDPNVRAAAADGLGVIADEAAGDALHEAAVDAQEDQLVRLSALRALSRIEHLPSVEELGTVLDDPLLRPAAFTLLGRIGDEAAVERLLKGTSLGSQASREAAMAALLHVVSTTDGAGLAALIEQIRELAAANQGLVEASVERLPDVDLATRLMLIQFLGLCEDARVVIPILEAGRDEAIAEVAHSTLEGLGELAISAFRSAWSSLDVQLRVDACRMMERSDGEAATPLLLASLDDADAELRGAAARALGRRHSMQALPTLICRLESAAQDDDPDAREEVDALIDALVALAPPDRSESASASREVIEQLSNRLEGSNEEVRLAIASVLGRIGRHADEELVATLLKDPSARVRRAAVEALARLEPGTASEPLRLALADESPLVRIAAAVALGQSDNPAVIDDLRRLIHDEDSRVSAAAVRSIGQHCRRENVSVEHGVELIEYSLRCEGMVALAGAEALCLMGGQRAATAALGLLGRPEQELVQSAVVCIAAHGDDETVAELISLVSHSSWSVRAEAIQTLADRRVVRAVPSILRRLETEQDSFVRDAILRALKQLED